MKSAEEIVIEGAGPNDVPAIRALLQEAGLPHEDFAVHCATFVVARAADGSVVGAVGAELQDGNALLRSLVVAPGWRGAGLGGRLVSELERRAAAWGVRRWWLLTTTAEAFFAARGFRAVERCGAPAGIQATGQFSGGCCSSAVCMARECAGGAG